MWPNPQFPADLITSTEEVLHGKLHFLCSDGAIFELWFNKLQGKWRLNKTLRAFQKNLNQFDNSIIFLTMFQKCFSSPFSGSNDEKRSTYMYEAPFMVIKMFNTTIPRRNGTITMSFDEKHLRIKKVFKDSQESIVKPVV